MKKLLIASAALAMVAGTAQAQSSVTVYGLIDAGYATSNTKYGAGLEINQKAVGGLHSANGTGTLSGSRLGFKGVEDLGGGLKANFVFEQGINYSGGGSATSAAASNTDAVATNGAGMGNVRQGWAGLSGGFGEVRIGTHNSLAKDATEDIDPNAGVTMTGWFGQTGLAVTRPTNSITYLSPVMNGFSFQAQYDEGESNTDTTTGKDNYGSALSLKYVNGPLTVVAAREERKKQGYAVNAALVDLPASDIVVPGASGTAAQVDKVTHDALGATYTINGIKLAALTTRLKYKDATAADNGEIKSNMLGVTVPVGANVLVRASISNGEIVDAGVKTHDLDGYQLVAMYNLSKRSHLYGAIGQSKYDSVTGTDVKINQMGVGMRHTF